jgi:hypothetical protein
MYKQSNWCKILGLFLFGKFSHRGSRFTAESWSTAFFTMPIIPCFCKGGYRIRDSLFFRAFLQRADHQHGYSLFFVRFATGRPAAFLAATLYSSCFFCSRRITAILALTLASSIDHFPVSFLLPWLNFLYCILLYFILDSFWMFSIQKNVIDS